MLAPVFIMGYRSTFITDHWGFTFSESFVEKYKERYNFGSENSLPISSKYEYKRFWDELEDDIVNELKLQNIELRLQDSEIKLKDSEIKLKDSEIKLKNNEIKLQDNAKKV